MSSPARENSPARTHAMAILLASRSCSSGSSWFPNAARARSASAAFPSAISTWSKVVEVAVDHTARRRWVRGDHGKNPPRVALVARIGVGARRLHHRAVGCRARLALGYRLERGGAGKSRGLVEPETQFVEQRAEQRGGGVLGQLATRTGSSRWPRPVRPSVPAASRASGALRASPPAATRRAPAFAVPASPEPAGRRRRREMAALPGPRQAIPVRHPRHPRRAAAAPHDRWRGRPAPDVDVRDPGQVWPAPSRVPAWRPRAIRDTVRRRWASEPTSARCISAPSRETQRRQTCGRRCRRCQCWWNPPPVPLRPAAPVPPADRVCGRTCSIPINAPTLAGCVFRIVAYCVAASP